MSQTVYYKNKFLIFLIFFSIIEAKLLRPSFNGDEKEILIINQKRRVYYPIRSEGLKYEVEGPMRLEFISRYPTLKKTQKKSIPYSYKIVIDNKDTILVNHRYKIQKRIKSIQHPKHLYTYSGNYFINIGRGNHTIELLKGKQKYPVLLRLITKEFETIGKNKKIITPMISKNSVSLISDDKELKYYECTSKIPLKIKAKKGKSLRILSRLEFSDSMGSEESYRIRVKENNKVVGTFYFSTERSSSSVIEEHPDKVPGKWRSCEITSSKKDKTYLIEIPDEGKVVLTRFMLY